MKKVIIDCDGSSDDFIAILYLLPHPQTNVEAITVAGTGEVHGPNGARNIADLCGMLGHKNMPIAYGDANPCDASGKPFPDKVRSLMDKLLEGKHIPANTDACITNSAVELIFKVVSESSEDKITIVATGPLTNIAQFIEKYPSLIDKIENIVIMGGAVRVKGNIRALDNTSTNDDAEWNVYADPKSAEIVFLSGVPVTLVPLDATNKVHMTEEFYNSLAQQQHPALRLIYAFLKDIVDNFGMDVFINEFYLWDPLAAMVLIHPDIAKKELLSILIDPVTAKTKEVENGTEKSGLIIVATDIPQPTPILSQLIDEIKGNLLNHQLRVNATNLFAKSKKMEEVQQPVPTRSYCLIN